MQSGLSLSLRNVSSMVVILTATSMVTGLGTITMAAHEILRQVWIISIQAFMALDICAQSLVASYLGQVRSQLCFGEAALSLLTHPAAVMMRMQMYKSYLLHSILNEHSCADFVAWVEEHCTHLYDKARLLRPLWTCSVCDCVL